MSKLTISPDCIALKDIRVTIDYLVNQKTIPLTPAKGWFSRKILFELNKYLTNPAEDITERSDQYRYPQLHFLF